MMVKPLNLQSVASGAQTADRLNAWTISNVVKPTVNDVITVWVTESAILTNQPQPPSIVLAILLAWY
jgi:hypothetical protein